jgi:DNA replication protein DnaC
MPPGMQHRDELEALAAMVTAGQAVSVVCAVGNRGVGKTQLAAALARRATEQWAWPLVAWVSAEALNVLVADLARVAQRVVA